MEILLEKINSAEQKWLKPLYNFIKTLFEQTNLPSHDAEHHLRVWLHCRDLIIELHNAGINVSLDTVDKAIIACFFHDAGLTQNLGEQHGFLGRKICEDYFRNDSYFQAHDMSEVLEAIEMHDDKSVKSLTETVPTLTKLISASDDLDAFGYIGIFRYIEIYLKRGIADREIPKMVNTNLQNRFSNFLNTYSILTEYTKIQKVRFNEIYDFFSELEIQFTKDSNNEDNQLTVFSILKVNLVEKKLGINETIEKIHYSDVDSYTYDYFTKLRAELKLRLPI